MNKESFENNIKTDEFFFQTYYSFAMSCTKWLLEKEKTNVNYDSNLKIHKYPFIKEKKLQISLLIF